MKNIVSRRLVWAATVFIIAGLSACGFFLAGFFWPHQPNNTRSQTHGQLMEHFIQIPVAALNQSCIIDSQVCYCYDYLIDICGKEKQIPGRREP